MKKITFLLAVMLLTTLLSGCSFNTENKSLKKINHTHQLEINELMQNYAGYDATTSEINNLYDYQPNDYIIANLNIYNSSGSYSSGQIIDIGTTVIGLNIPFNIGLTTGGWLFIRSNGSNAIGDSMSYFTTQQLSKFIKSAVLATESKYTGYYLNNINSMGTGFIYGLASSSGYSIRVLGIISGDQSWNILKVSDNCSELKEHKQHLPEGFYEFCISKG